MNRGDADQIGLGRTAQLPDRLFVLRTGAGMSGRSLKEDALRHGTGYLSLPTANTRHDTAAEKTDYTWEWKLGMRGKSGGPKH